jgi:5'-phosphate synthase pdxT subunit
MALIAEQWGLIPELQRFAQQGRPIWGTCAGMIFLAERAEGAAPTTLVPSRSLMQSP